MNPTVLYHGPQCLDGFTAAWITQKMYPSAVFIPIDYHQLLPKLRPTVVYMLDFTPNDADAFKGFIHHHHRVIHLDHHLGAQPLLEAMTVRYLGTGKYKGQFQETASGCGLTWDHFSIGPRRPTLVNRVEDRDLWRFRYADTKAFTEGLMTLDKTFDNWDYAATKKGHATLTQLGADLLTKRLNRCQVSIHDTLQWILLKDVGQEYVIPVTHAERPDDVSDQVHLMVEQRLGQIVGVYQDVEPDLWKIRLGSAANGPSVIPLAQSYGGGGHPHAASFRIARSELCFVRV